MGNSWRLAIYAGALLTGLTAFGSLHVEKVCDLPAGADCESALIVGQDGTMYGATRGAGQSSQGSIFSITTDGVFTTLYSFSGPDGADPRTSLTFDASGNLYGTTAAGGSAGLGTIFLLTGTSLQTLHIFNGSPDGATPGSALISRNGYFYGTTRYGGSTWNNGTFFKISPAGDYQILHTFLQYDSVSMPWGDLTLADGTLYGCGVDGIGEDLGGIIRIDGSDQYAVEEIAGHHSGLEAPNGGLLYLSGTLFGTSALGNTGSMPVGSVFAHRSIFPNPDLLIHLYDYNGFLPEYPNIYPHYLYDSPAGSVPLAGLTDATNGDLLGSNSMGGANSAGTLFRVDLTLTSPYPYLQQPFCYGDFFSFGGIYGSTPVAAMVQGTDGNFYGAASTGGAYGGGTIYRVLQNKRPTAPDLQFTRISGQTLVVNLLAQASDPDGDPLSFIGLFPFDIEEPATLSSDGIVSIPEYGHSDQFEYVVSDGMDVARGQVTVTNTSPSPSPSPNVYTGTLMRSGTAVGSLQITVTTSTYSNGEVSTSITGIFGYQNNRNSFVAASRKARAGVLNGTTLTATPARGWHLTLKDDYDLQWLATLTGTGGTYSLVLQPQTASGIVHQYYTATLQESGTNKGAGFAFLVLDDASTIRLTGKLPNAAPFTGSATAGAGQGTIVSASGTAGRTLGTVQISSTASPSLTGTITWQSGTNSLPAQLTASPYTVPSSAQSALNLRHGNTCHIVFTRPNGATFAKNALLNEPNASTSTPGIEFIINPRTGLLMGTVLDPMTNRPLPFQGAVMQQANTAVGYLLDGKTPGQFILTLKN